MGEAVRTDVYAAGITVSVEQADNTTDPIDVGATDASFVDAVDADEDDDDVGAHTLITVHTFDADKEVTVTVKGLTNSDTGRIVTVTFRQGNQSPGAMATDEVVAPPPVLSSVTSSTDKASTATRLTIVSKGDTLGEIGPGDEIVVNLKDFGLPTSIDTEDVTIDDGEWTSNPSAVRVSGDNVSITLGKFTDEVLVGNNRVTAGNSHAANVIDGIDAKVTIVIRERANIMTPTKAGMYPVKIDGKDSADETGYDIEYMEATEGTEGTEDTPAVDGLTRVEIVLSVSVKPTSAVRGTEITITGKGFSDGAASVKAGDETIGSPSIADGSFTSR